MKIKTPSFELAAYAKGDEKAEKVALVLPGRLDTKDYIHMTTLVDSLAGQGYYALSFDPPSSWESSGDPNDYTTTNYTKAVHELIEHLGNRPTVLAGHSRGGAVSIVVGASNPNVKAIVPIMASYGNATGPSQADIEAGIYRTTRDILPGDHRSTEQIPFSLPLSYFEDAEQYNPAEEIKKITIPKLLIYGTTDKFTTPERVKEVFASTPEPKELLELDCGHDYRYHPEMVAKVNTAITAFLNKYLSE